MSGSFDERTATGARFGSMTTYQSFPGVNGLGCNALRRFVVQRLLVLRTPTGRLARHRIADIKVKRIKAIHPPDTRIWRNDG